MFTNSAKKTFTLLCTLMLALVFVGTSCKKDEEKTSKDFLVAHDWKLTGFTIAGVNALEECDKDDVLTFDKDGSFLYDAGATKCFESDLQQEMGNWSISTSTTPETFTMTYSGNTSPTYEAKITNLDNEQMVLTVEFNIGGVTSTQVSTFEKK